MYGMKTLTLKIVMMGFVSLAASNAVAEEQEARWNPASSGPFFTSTSDTTPPGSFFAEVYGYLGFQQASHNLSVPLRFDQGVVPNVEFDITTPYEHTWITGPAGTSGSGGGVGDTLVFFKFRFLNETSSFPSLAIMPMLTLPSGNATDLNPSQNGADQTGQGALEGTIALLARKLIRPFKLYGELAYTGSGTLKMVPGYSLTNLNSISPGQTVVPGDNFYYSFAFEHVLNDQNGLGYILEFYGNHAFATSLLSGSASTSSWTQVSLAPEIEFDTGSFQWAGGISLPVLSTGGAPASTTYMLTVTWQYDGPLGHR